MKPRHQPGRRASGGFSLIEISIVLIIAGLALGGLLSVLGPQLQLRKYTETQKQLKDVSDSLLAYAMVNRRLPCPATATSNGQEAFCTTATGACGAQVVPPAASAGRTNGRCFAAANAGFVPAVTLGLGGISAQSLAVDGWAGALRYTPSTTLNTTANNAVTALGCSAANPCYPATQSDGLRNAYYNSGVATGIPASTLAVCRTATGITPATCGAAPLLATPAFVVYSYGANLNGGALGVDETANTNADPVYVMHERSEAAAPNGAFDDLLEWATLPQLIARMQGNGVLP